MKLGGWSLKIEGGAASANTTSANTNLKKCDNDDMFMGVRADAGLPQQLLDLPSEGAVRSILVLLKQDVKMARS